MKASNFLQFIAELDVDQLKNIKGVGSKIAQNIKDYTSTKAYTQLQDKFAELEACQKGVEVVIPQFSHTPIKGVVCITGSFSIPRSKIVEIITQKGYKVANSLTSEVTLLLAGEESGSKLEKAQSKGIPVIYSYMDL